jgi:hypothetical protein
LRALSLSVVATVAIPGVASAQPTDDAGSLARFELEMAGPSSMVLGLDESVSISLRDSGQTPRLYTNVGTISQPSAADDGRLRAAYTPPSSRFPQVAIIVAVNENHTEFDWLTIPLHARPNLTIESEARATVTVRVGDREFGPIQTDRKGRGSIELEVPPGIDTVVVVSRDKLGNTQETSRELGVPGFQRLVAVCPTGGDDLLLFTVDAVGAPDSSAHFELSATTGTLDDAVVRAPGAYTARYVVPDGVATVDEADVTASIAGDSASTMMCRADVPAELPQGLVVGFDRDSYVAGSGPVLVTVSLQYSGTRAMRPVRPELEATVGTLSELEPVTEFEYRATWHLPDELGGATEASIRAAAREPILDARGVVALGPAGVSRLVASMSRGWVRADGMDDLTIRVEAFDRFGNRTAASGVSARGIGRVSPFEVGDGASVAVYTAPVRYEAGQDSVMVQHAESETTTSVVVDLRPIARRFRTNARAGLTTNFGAIATAVLAADVSMRLAMASRRISVGVESGYYASSTSELRDDGAEQVELSATVVPLIARAAYHLDYLPVEIYGGVGLGVLLAKTQVQSPDSGMRVVSKPRFVATGVAGARKSVGPGALLAEVAYWYSAVDDAGLEGNIGGLRVTGGYGIDF